MWGWKKRIMEQLTRVEGKVEQLVGLMEKDERLEKQNKDLFDRLMSGSWEKYAQHSPDVYNRLGEKKETQYVLSPLNDEANAGGILSDEELGKPGK